MRNLKRALSLALAAAMLIGMMVVGASAMSYKDESGIKNTEAVDLLTAIGVVGGDQNGNYNPTKTLTRAEFCVMMANVLTGSKFDAALFDGTNTPFTDVTGHWGAPYIEYCYGKVITGKTATTFDPNGTLTAVQAEAILLSALGYNQNGEFGANGQFELNVTTWAQKAGLLEDVSVSAKTSITRDVAAQMLFNALTYATPVGYSKLADNYYTVGTSAVNGQVFFGDTNYNYTLAYTSFNVNSYAKTDNGETGHVWANMNTPTKAITGFYMTDKTLATSTNGTAISALTTKTNSKFVAELDTTSASGAWTQLKFYLNGTELAVVANSGSTTAGQVYINASDLTAPKIQVAAGTTANHSTDPEYTKKGAIVTFLDKDESGVYDGKAETVTILEKSIVELTRDVATVTSGSVTTLKSAIGSGDNAVPAGTNVVSITGYEGLKKGDVVAYHKMASDFNGDVHYFIEKIEPATVTINSVNLANGKVSTTAGTYEQSGLVAYVKDSSTLAGLASGNLNKDATFYVDDLGYVVMVKDIDVVDNYLVVLGKSYDTIDGLRVRAVDETGAVVTVKVSKVGGAAPAADTAVTEKSVVYKYVVTDKGYELTAYTAAPGSPVAGVQYLANETGATPTLSKNVATVTVNSVASYANDKTIFVVESWDGTAAAKTNVKQTIYTGIKAVPSIGSDSENVFSAVYEQGTNNIAKYVFVSAKSSVISGSVTTSDVIFITSKDAVETKVGDTSYYTYDAVVNGAVTTITATSAGKTSIESAITVSGNRIGLVTITNRDGSYVTAVSTGVAAYTNATTLNAANIASIGDGTIIGTSAIPGTASKSVMQYNDNTQVVIRDKDGKVDVNATVNDIDVENDYVMIVPTSDNADLADVIYVCQK